MNLAYGILHWRQTIIGVALVAAGCQHVAPPPDTGTSSFAFVEPPPAPPSKATPTATKEPVVDQFREAWPVPPLVTPVYPPRALAAKAGRVIVGVHITVDTDGRVSTVAPSMLAFSTPGPWADEFMAAVELALRQWRFWPAEIRHLENVQTPDVAYERVTRLEKIEAQFDLSFTFTAKDGIEFAPAGK